MDELRQQLHEALAKNDMAHRNLHRTLGGRRTPPESAEPTPRQIKDAAKRVPRGYAVVRVLPYTAAVLLAMGVWARTVADDGHSARHPARATVADLRAAAGRLRDGNAGS